MLVNGSLPILTDFNGSFVRVPRMFNTESSVVKASKPLRSTAKNICDEKSY